MTTCAAWPPVRHRPLPVWQARHGAKGPESRAARKEDEHRVLREIVRDYATREERVEEWTKRTGKSERAFYRRLAEIDSR